MRSDRKSGRIPSEVFFLRGITMGIRKYTLTEDSKLTEEQKEMIKAAARKTITFDEDSPELTEAQLAEFSRVHEEHTADRRRQNVTLRLKPQTIRKAKSLGKGYTGILSRIVEDFLDDPVDLKKYS